MSLDLSSFLVASRPLNSWPNRENFQWMTSVLQLRWRANVGAEGLRAGNNKPRNKEMEIVEGIDSFLCDMEKNVSFCQNGDDATCS